jgi:hypothetical protein
LKLTKPSIMELRSLTPVLDRQWGSEALKRPAVAFFALAILAAAPATADVGLPMLALFLPPAWLLLVPVIGIEALVGIRRYGQPGVRALWVQSVANLVSTLLGVPLVWSVVTGLELGVVAALWPRTQTSCLSQATLQAWWILPPLRRCAWVFPVASVVAGAGFYACSVLVEYWVVRACMRSPYSAALRRWVLEANLWSYALLAAAVFAFQIPAFEWVWHRGFEVVERFAGITFGLARLLGLR